MDRSQGSNSTTALSAYAVAAAAIVLALILRLLLEPVLQDRAPLLVFTPAVMVAAWFGGFGPGLLATALATVLAIWFLIEPKYSLRLGHLRDFVHVGLFLFTGVVISALNETLGRVRGRASRSDEVVRDSEARLRAIVDTAVDGIITIDERAVIDSVNPAVERMFGYTAGELVGQNVKILMPDPYRREHDQYMENYHRTGVRKIIGVGREVVGRRKDGTTFPLDLAVSEFTVGGRRRYAGIVHDVSERKRQEEALRESTEQLRLVVEGVHDYAIIMIDAEGKVVTWNTGAERIKGYEAEEIIGKPYETFFTPEDRAAGKPQRMLAAARERGSVQDQGLRRRKDGATFWADAVLTALRDSTGRLRGYAKITRDITSWKQAETELTSARDAAEQSHLAKDRFIAVISHELRTPLTPALAAASAMESDRRLPEDVREDVQTIRRNIEIEARLVNDLLDVSANSAGGLHLHFETVDAHVAVREAIAICQQDVTRKNLALAVDLKAERSFVWGDPTRLRQIVWNLLRNALKFTPEGGSITVGSTNEDGQLVISVTDTGIGLDAEHMTKLFQAFDQSDVLARRFGGLGLGLSISKSLVEAHGGTLDASSSGRHRGATFTVKLKSIDAAMAGPPGAHTGASADLPPGTAPAQPCLKILLVEDNEDTSRVMAKLLRAYGFDVTTAATVEEGLKHLDTTMFDLLISDIGLPDGTGWDLMKRVAAKQQKRLRSIALSGYGMDADLKNSREAGFMAHLTKPVDFKQLEQVIQEVCAR